MAADIVPDAIRRYFDDVNREDWDDFRTIWHPEAELRVVGGIRLRGAGEVAAYYPGVLASFPVHHDDPYAIHVAGEVVAVEIAFTGETADGVAAAFEAVDVFHLEGGRVGRLSIWYDLNEVLGFLRRPGTPERRLTAVLAAASLESLEQAEPVREAPPPAAVRVVLPGGTPVAAGDWEERVRLWRAAIAIAGAGPGEVVAIASLDPAFAEAAGRAGQPFALSSADSSRAIDVLTWPETGPVAVACGRGAGYHVLADGHAVEIVEGELLVTPLRRSEPLVRFAPGVRAAWVDGPCPCGRTLPRVEVTG